MDNKTKRIAFIGVNLVLVAIVGLILGFCVPMKDDSAKLLSFILLLVTLCTPTLMFLFVKDIVSPLGIGSLLFLVANVAVTIVFLATAPNITTVGITEGAIIAAFLVLVLICIACAPKKE